MRLEVPEPALTLAAELLQRARALLRTLRFRAKGEGIEWLREGLRQRDPAIESAIGALQADNGQERCRDKRRLGYERYVGLGVLGKLLLAQDDANRGAANSKREAPDA